MKKIFLFSLLGLLFFSCVNLDVPRKNAVTDDVLLSNDAGMKVYITRLYTMMPFEDLKYMAKWGFNYSSWLGALGIEGTGESANRAIGDGDLASPFRREDTPYWNKDAAKPFELIRLANHLIETLPQYRSNFPEMKYNQYLGEAYFARAMAFYAMAKRFGGVPLVLKQIDYPKETGATIARSSEEETWNQILADFDMAISLMQPTNVITGLKFGSTNKYVVMAYKAEAMNYAGCVAKYNQTVSGNLTGFGANSGVRVIGFAPDSWEAASKKYFREAYKAANEVIKSEAYSLYKKAWKAGDPDAQYQNMVDMFKETGEPETMLVKEYQYPTYTHGIDGYSSPWSFRGPLSGGSCPTLDFVELFDGFDRYPNGTIRVTTGNSNTEGTYIMYNTTMDFFANAEPRLRAYVILPGDVFRGKVMEVRAGIYTGTSPVQPFYTTYAYSDATTLYQDLPIYYDTDTNPTGTLRLGGGPAEQKPVDIGGGKTMNPSGAEGPFMSQSEACLTGFHLRKYLSTDPNFAQGEGKSDQPFILMRYADVLLAAAEAAVELSLAGETSPDGSNMLTVATKAINDIRERAGANLLAGNLTADNASRDIVRKERRKELAFEHKTKWDLRRWRVQHQEGRGGFWGEQRDASLYSNGELYRFRGLYPFYSVAEGKYFFDAHFQWVAGGTLKYNVIDYYFEIPGGEVTKSNGVIDQQPNR